MHVVMQQTVDKNTRQIHKGGPPLMSGQQNVRIIARDNTGHNRDNELPFSPRIEIKISEPAGYRTRAAELEGGDYTDHATETESCYYSLVKIFVVSLA